MAQPTAPRRKSTRCAERIPGCASSSTRSPAARRRRCEPACAPRADDPAYLPKLIDALEQGAPKVGLIAGQRIGRKTTGFKKFQSRIANAVRGAILRDGTRDSGCGYMAFSREVGLALPHFDGLHRFLPALVRREGKDIGYVDVVDRPRQHGVSNYGFWDRLWVGILDLAGVWWLIRRSKRVPEVSEV
jgi:dolichol-phosphate mannosyltransferase